MQYFNNEPLIKEANRVHLRLQRIVCGYVPTGCWKSSLPVDRLIYVFESGCEVGSIAADDDRCALLPYTWLFIPAYCSVLHEENPGLKLVSVHFNAEYYDGLELFAECRKPVHGTAPEHEADFRRLLEPSGEPSNAFRLKHLLYRFMGEKILPELPGNDGFRDRYRNFAPLVKAIQSDPRRNLTVPQMAKIMNMGKDSFIKHFQVETGTSPKLFFNRIRAAAAADALNHPDVRIRDIAFAFGFANEFYFSRFFKRHFGLSPKTYREKFC